MSWHVILGLGLDSIDEWNANLILLYINHVSSEIHAGASDCPFGTRGHQCRKFGVFEIPGSGRGPKQFD